MTPFIGSHSTQLMKVERLKNQLLSISSINDYLFFITDWIMHLLILGAVSVLLVLACVIGENLFLSFVCVCVFS